MILPSFLYIGAGKSGSSWLYEVLRSHSEIFIPDAKDLQFFDKYFDKGIQWYAGHFVPGKEKKCRGEISHNYFRSAQTLERIARFLPDVTLFCCLREPLDRTISAYLHAVALGIAPKGNFAAYAMHPETLRTNSYYSNLVPVYDLFPTENIHILFFDDLRSDPVMFLSTVYQSLKVKPLFPSHLLNEKVLGARQARFPHLSAIAYRAAAGLRSLGLANFVGSVKRNALFDNFLYRPLIDKPQFDPDILRRIEDFYSKQYRDLEKLIGRDLPPNWHGKLSSHASVG